MVALFIAGCVLLFSTPALASEVAHPAIPKWQITETETKKPVDVYVNTLPSKKTIYTTPLFKTKNSQPRTTLRSNVDIANLYQRLLQISPEFETKPQSAEFVMTNQRVTSFKPEVWGEKMDPVQSVVRYLQTNPTTFTPETIHIPPPQTLHSTNTLGIQDIIARGVSNFKGSSKNRRTNIRVAVEKMRGVLVAPGKNFSFNDNVGDVSAKDGFVPEIVIKKDGLKPELGGGVCQVSSTIFRAVMASGMPIAERKNHSFPVNHYAPQGTDATTYTGVIDFKFTNDTPNYILLWPYFTDDDTLVFDIYGTDDGRRVEVSSPIKYGFQSNGIFKTKWTRTVQKPNDTVRTDDLVSTYLPASWFKKEEKFVTATPSPIPPTENITPLDNAGTPVATPPPLPPASQTPPPPDSN